MRFIKLNITGSDKMRATGCMNAACKTRLMWYKKKIVPSVRAQREPGDEFTQPRAYLITPLCSLSNNCMEFPLRHFPLHESYLMSWLVSAVLSH